MFILTNIDVRQNLVQVYDTDDGSNDVVSLSATASKIRGNRFKVYGLGKLSARKSQTSQPIDALGIYVDIVEAREAFATYYQKCGMTREAARIRAGLSAK